VFVININNQKLGDIFRLIEPSSGQYWQ